MSWGRPLACLLILALVLPGLQAQSLHRGLGIDVSGHTGFILKHTSNLTFTPPPLSGGLDVSLVQQTYGRHDWEAWNRYPVFGANALWFDLGSDELGQAIALFPFVDIPVLKRSRWQAGFRVGSGLAWLTRHYDRITNPLNNAIGSNLNNVSAFRFLVGFRFHRHWTGMAGLSFTHFSNGQAQTPNYGINVVAGSVGLRYTPRPLGPEDFFPASGPATPTRRWGISTHAGLAFREYFAYGGPRYPVVITSLGALWQLSRINRLVAGLEYEYNHGIYTFSKLNWQFQGDNTRFWAASRLMVFGGDEFLFGHWSILVQMGTYLGHFGYLIPFPVYNKLAIRYYFPPIHRPSARIFAGVYLKSHMITAEYISLGLGVSFE